MTGAVMTFHIIAQNARAFNSFLKIEETFGKMHNFLLEKLCKKTYLEIEYARCAARDYSGEKRGKMQPRYKRRALLDAPFANFTARGGKEGIWHSTRI